MESLINVLSEILEIVNEMSPYLLLGFLLAGLMHAFIPGNLYSKYLSGNSLSSVIYAALFGIPLPLCSCGVIPTAMSLRKEGASKGSAVSFLIATPQTGVDSIIATYSLMGLPFAIIRPFAALITAVFGGQMVNVANRNRKDDGDLNVEVGGCGCGKTKPANGFAGRMKEALSYAFVEMMEDIGKWLVVGLIVAGLITVLVPDSFFEVFKDNTFLSMLLVLCIAIPMYICATGSIPIAVALMLKGLTPGAALVLLMAGPACNVASILVINKILGRRTLITYLASIISGSILFGIGIDYLLPAEWFMPTVSSVDTCHESFSLFCTICTIVLALLLVNALWHHHTHPHNHEGADHNHQHEHCCCAGEHEHEHEHEHVHESEKESCCCKNHNQAQEHNHDHEQHEHCCCKN
ncbi:MAG: SO_0444 family Cu/Zn efflux transporter [Salinivirgaceae bacterium]|nr:SO_0444 family Cu/Zn efflux transporter [Salinivirgaceae bacterium]